MKAAFTLIELLVVIVVIAVLTAISLPVVANTRVVSNRTACAANMRQMGAALLLYANDNNGRFPESTHTADDEKHAWIYTLAPYLGDLDKVRICPADPVGPERLANKGTSYVLNEYIVVPATDRFGRVTGSHCNIRSLTRPASTLVAFIAADGTNSDHTHSRNWHKNWQAVCRDIAPDRHRVGAPNSQRTNGSANYLYADGHVANIEAAAFRDMFGDDGVGNPARPPE